MDLHSEMIERARRVVLVADGGLKVDIAQTRMHRRDYRIGNKSGKESKLFVTVGASRRIISY